MTISPFAAREGTSAPPWPNVKKCCRHLSRTKNQPKEEVFGPDIPRTSGGHSRGYPGPKLRSGRSKSWKNKHLGADIHDPKARTCTTLRDSQKLRSEKLGAEFSFPNLVPSSALSTFSLVFLFPWSFSSWEFPWCFWVFSAYFTGFSRVRTVRKSLMFLRFSLVFSKRPRKRRTGWLLRPVIRGAELVRKAPDTFNFLRHVMRAILSGRPNCSHRCVSLNETPLKPVEILKSTTNNSAEQTSMRAKCFKHIAI